MSTEAFLGARRTDLGTARLAWVDELRFFSFCAVVLLHVAWISSFTIQTYDLIAFSTRFAVPAFFMISGFMIERKQQKGDEVVRNVLRRLVPIFLFWEAVYILVDIVARGALYPLPQATVTGLLRFVAVTFYTGGVAFHLWFVVWLAVSIVIFVTLRRLGRRMTWIGGGLLFLLGLAIGPYGGFTGLLGYVGALTPHPIAYTARNGPFFGPLFLTIGALIARRNVTLHPGFAWALTGLGLTAEVAEGILISSHSQRFVSAWDVTFGTPLMALGVFFLFRGGGGTAGWMAVLGRYSLGMYCVHALFTTLWNTRFLPEERASTPVLVTLAGALALVVASVVVTLALSRVACLRRFVT